MKERATVLLLLLISVFSVFAETNTKEIPDVTFTAYKGQYNTNGLPVATGEFRLITAEQESLPTEPITVEKEFRNTEYNLFSWIASGNHAGNITLSFTFTPLSLTKDNETSTIPYIVKMTHSTSLMDSVLIAVNRDVSNLSPRKCTFSEDYFCWADTVTTRIGTTGDFSESESANPSISTEVNASDVTIAFQYNMANLTVTKEKNSNNEWVLITDGFDSNNIPKAKAYPYNVTDHWTRSGECLITLKITSDGKSITTNGTGTAFTMGLYQAQVTVEMQGP